MWVYLLSYVHMSCLVLSLALGAADSDDDSLLLQSRGGESAGNVKYLLFCATYVHVYVCLRVYMLVVLL
jgi:hypothetical protein